MRRAPMELPTRVTGRSPCAPAARTWASSRPACWARCSATLHAVSISCAAHPRVFRLAATQTPDNERLCIALVSQTSGAGWPTWMAE